MKGMKGFLVAMIFSLALCGASFSQGEGADGDQVEIRRLPVRKAQSVDRSIDRVEIKAGAKKKQPDFKKAYSSNSSEHKYRSMAYEANKSNAAGQKLVAMIRAQNEELSKQNLTLQGLLKVGQKQIVKLNGDIDGMKGQISSLKDDVAWWKSKVFGRIKAILISLGFGAAFGFLFGWMIWGRENTHVIERSAPPIVINSTAPNSTTANADIATEVNGEEPVVFSMPKVKLVQKPIVSAEPVKQTLPVEPVKKKKVVAAKTATKPAGVKKTAKKKSTS